MLTTFDKAEDVMRIAIWLLSVAALVYGLTVAVFGVIYVIGGITSGLTQITVDGSGSTSFTTVGEAGISVTGISSGVVLFVPDLPVGLVALHATAALLSVLLHLSLSLAAVALGRALLRGRPFDRPAALAIEIAVVSLLGFGIAAQIVDWLADVTILDYLGDYQFSRAFTFDPVAVTGALALALVAIAFRAGTGLQRDTEGLV
jgi:hypothetical protein